MRALAFAAALLAAGQAQGQTRAQEELNQLTGAPPGTRCFKSIALAQELATRYVASGICPQLRPMDPGQFLGALQTQRAIDRDFTSEVCQLQFSLMFRAGREWVEKAPTGSCIEVVRKLRKLKGPDIFGGLLR